MKKCIWCSKDESSVTFDKLAHTIPQSLGGKNVCVNVCDNCNSYFGNYQNKIPSIETVLKEALNISRMRLIDKDQIGKNKIMPRVTSTYFNINVDKMKISLKASYKFHSHFQETLGRQLKKGLYKIYLEEIERQRQDAHLPKYDFIREFCRYDLGDYPLFYFERKHGIMLLSKSWIETPELFLDDKIHFKYITHDSSFFEFELFGHAFGIVTSRQWNLSFDSYIKKSVAAKKDTFKNVVQVNKFNEIDLTLNIMNS